MIQRRCARHTIASCPASRSSSHVATKMYAPTPNAQQYFRSGFCVLNLQQIPTLQQRFAPLSLVCPTPNITTVFLSYIHMQAAAAVREAGFNDTAVLKIVHLCTGSGVAAEGDESAPHITCQGQRENRETMEEECVSVCVPTAPSYAVAGVLFQLQGNSWWWWWRWWRW